MGLEKDIEQKTTFPNDESRALVNILYSSAWLTERLKSHFKPYGITPKQYNILRILNGAEEPMSTSQIRGRMLDKMSDVTRLIDRMVLKEWITKKESKIDRRLVDVRIIREGQKLLNDIGQAITPIDNIMSNLNQNECAQLNLLLDKMRS